MDGHELARLERLADLPHATRALLQEELALRDFVPEVRQLKSVSSFGTANHWTEETDRGETTFVLKGKEDTCSLGHGALRIAGSEGVQYSIADMKILDRASRRLLEQFL